MTQPETRAPDRLLNWSEVCDLLGIGRTKLWELRQQGHLPEVRMPSATGKRRALRWRQSDVEAFIQASSRS